jgi:hypothetical protein
MSRELEKKGFQVIGRMFDRPNKMSSIHPKSSKGILFELAEQTILELAK